MILLTPIGWHTFHLTYNFDARKTIQATDCYSRSPIIEGMWSLQHRYHFKLFRSWTFFYNQTQEKLNFLLNTFGSIRLLPLTRRLSPHEMTHFLIRTPQSTEPNHIKLLHVVVCDIRTKATQWTLYVHTTQTLARQPHRHSISSFGLCVMARQLNIAAPANGQVIYK